MSFIDTRVEAKNKCYFVVCCLFSAISGSDYGGAISVGGEGSCFKCDMCKFYKVSSIQYHAAIYCDSYSTNSSVEKCDISYCSAYDHSGISLYSVNSVMSHVSAYRCHENVGGCWNIVLIHVYGTQESKYINASITNANHHSGHIFHSATDVKPSSFFNIVNHRSTDFVFGMYSVPNGVSLSNVSIINNTVTWALIYLNLAYNAQLSSFVFALNNGPLTDNRGYLPGSGDFINCIYDTASVQYGGGVQTQINPIFNQNSPKTHEVYDFDDQQCEFRTYNPQSFLRMSMKYVIMIPLIE